MDSWEFVVHERWSYDQVVGQDPVPSLA